MEYLSLFIAHGVFETMIDCTTIKSLLEKEKAMKFSTEEKLLE